MRLFQAEWNGEKGILRRGKGMCKAELCAIAWFIQVSTPLHATGVKEKRMREPWKEEWAPNVKCYREADIAHGQNIPQSTCNMEITRDLGLNRPGSDGLSKMGLCGINRMSYHRKKRDCLKPQKHHRIKGRFCSGFDLKWKNLITG